MSLIYSQDEQMLLESAQVFLSEESPVSAQRHLRDNQTQQAFDPALWQGMVDMGWTAIPFSEQSGGLAFGSKGMGSVFTEIGRNLTASPLLSSVVLSGCLIENIANQSHIDTWLASIISGEKRWSLALEESHVHDPQSVSTSLVKKGNGYELQGRKVLVIDGMGADAFVVIAKLQDELCAVTVPAGAKGMTVTANHLIDARNMAQVKFDSVPVDSHDIIAIGEQALDALESSIDLARVCLAAEIFGACEALMEMTIEYLKTRQQFEATIGSFQALQHRAAWCFVELELAKSTLMAALADADSSDAKARSQMISLAKWKVNQVADLITKEAIQMHGGIGVTDELDVGLYLKRIRVAQMLLGDSEYHLQRYTELTQ